MKVKELIEQLQHLPSDAPVVVAGYEAGVNDIFNIRIVNIRRDVNSEEEWYYGKHEIIREDDPNAHEGTLAIYIY